MHTVAAAVFVIIASPLSTAINIKTYQTIYLLMTQCTTCAACVFYACHAKISHACSVLCAAPFLILSQQTQFYVFPTANFAGFVSPMCICVCVCVCVFSFIVVNSFCHTDMLLLYARPCTKACCAHRE